MLFPLWDFPLLARWNLYIQTRPRLYHSVSGSMRSMSICWSCQRLSCAYLSQVICASQIGITKTKILCFALLNLRKQPGKLMVVQFVIYLNLCWSNSNNWQTLFLYTCLCHHAFIHLPSPYLLNNTFSFDIFGYTALKGFQHASSSSTCCGCENQTIFFHIFHSPAANIVMNLFKIKSCSSCLKSHKEFMLFYIF